LGWRRQPGNCLISTNEQERTLILADVPIQQFIDKSDRTSILPAIWTLRLNVHQPGLCLFLHVNAAVIASLGGVCARIDFLKRIKN
jgi:hypothetical protein